MRTKLSTSIERVAPSLGLSSAFFARAIVMIRGGGSSGLMDQWLFAEDEAQVEGILGEGEILGESGSAVARYGRRPWAHLTHAQK